MPRIQISKIDPPAEPLRAQMDNDGLISLAQSLKKKQLQPIGVRPITGTDRYVVVWGHRRRVAAELAGLTHLDCKILSPEEAGDETIWKLIENVMQEALSPVEEACGLGQIVLKSARQAARAAGLPEPTEVTMEMIIAADLRRLMIETSKSEYWVNSRLEILLWPTELQAAVHQGALTQGVARHLASITDPERLTYYMNEAIQNGCKEWQAEVWARAANVIGPAVETGLSFRQAQEAEAQAQKQPEWRQHCFACGVEKSQSQLMWQAICSPCHDHIASARGPVESLGHCPVCGATGHRREYHERDYEQSI